MKPRNWISATGTMPATASPIADADDRRLGQRRVDHALAAEAIEQPVGGAEHAAVVRHVLAEDDDALVARHLLVERGVDRLHHGHDRHDVTPPAVTPELAARGEVSMAPGC